MNNRYYKFFFTLLTLAECRIFHVNYINDRDMRSTEVSSLGQQQALSVVHCSLICINTNGCFSTILKGDRCHLIRRRRHRQIQHLVENDGAVMTQLDKQCLPNPCLYHGSCIENGFDFKCSCAWSRVGKICEIKVLESSCLAIHEKYPFAPTGWYHIYSSLEKNYYITAYCDMENGGGWMKVLNARLETDSIKDDPIYQVRFLSNLGSMGNFVLRLETLMELKKLIGFKQMRFRCSAGGVFMHIETTPNAAGNASVTFLSSYTYYVSPPFCGAFAALHDDKSGVLQNCKDRYLAGSIFGGGVVDIPQIWNAGIWDWFMCVNRIYETKRGDFWEAFVR